MSGTEEVVGKRPGRDGASLSDGKSGDGRKKLERGLTLMGNLN
jgi:hypothetical protein